MAIEIAILCIGRVRKAPELDLFARYCDRLTWTVTVKEMEYRRPVPAAERRRRESDMLAAAVPAGAIQILLDEQGKNLTSDGFAEHLGKWFDQGRNKFAFIIGGADGVDHGVVKNSDLKLALGRLTWPHLLVRVMLAEQLYRAHTILTGHPYHRN